MTQVTIDNPPVSIVLEAGESFTVPSGEVLRVNFSVNRDNNEIKLNGAFVQDSLNGETVLVGGDKIKLETFGNGQSTVHLGGFDVS
jgi:hypothetical protein